MSIRVELTPEMEADLAAQAARSGVSLDQYVRTVLEKQASPAPIRPLVMSAAERARAFEEWAEKFPYRRTEPLPDEAVARESFYLDTD